MRQHFQAELHSIKACQRLVETAGFRPLGYARDKKAGPTKPARDREVWARRQSKRARYIVPLLKSGIRRRWRDRASACARWELIVIYGNGRRVRWIRPSKIGNE